MSSDDGVVAESGSGLFEQSLSGAPTPLEDGSEEQAAAPAPYELNGYVRGDVFVGKAGGSPRGELKAGYGELALALKIPGGHYGDAYAETRLRHGQQGEQRDLSLDLREAYVNAYLGPFDLRLGQQIIVWGRANGYNPTNNLSAVNLRVRSPVEDDRRVGNVGARAFLNFAPVRLEGVWMPLYSPTEIPPLPFPAYVTLSEPDYPEPELSNGLMAGRLHLELPAFELSGSYVYGYAPLPGLALSGFGDPEDPPQIRISRAAYQHHVVGFDFSTAIGEVLAVRGEAAYRFPPDYETQVYAPRPDLQYVLGIDRSFGPVSIIVQYVGRYVFDWQRDQAPEDPETDLEDLVEFPEFVQEAITPLVYQELASRNQLLFSQLAEVQHLASLRVEWLTLHETLSVSALAAVNVTTKEWLAYPKIRYQLSDGMSTTVGAEIYLGPEDTMFGLIDEELSAGYGELRFSF